MRSKNPPQPSFARSNSSVGMSPRCSITISVRPSSSSLRTTTTRWWSSPGASVMVNASRSFATTSRYSPRHSVSPPSARTMIALQAPPGRTSIDTRSTGTSKGPANQSENASGVVHSRHTCSRGASNTRLTLMPYPSVIAQPLVHAIEALLPEPTVPVQPGRGVPERLPAEARGPQLLHPPALDEARVAEDLEVLGHGLHADREGLR